LGAGHITIVVKRTGFRSAAFVAECHKPCTAATCLLPRSLAITEVMRKLLFMCLIFSMAGCATKTIKIIDEKGLPVEGALVVSEELPFILQSWKIGAYVSDKNGKVKVVSYRGHIFKPGFYPVIDSSELDDSYLWEAPTYFSNTTPIYPISKNSNIPIEVSTYFTIEESDKGRFDIPIEVCGTIKVKYAVEGSKLSATSHRNEILESNRFHFVGPATNAKKSILEKENNLSFYCEDSKGLHKLGVSVSGKVWKKGIPNHSLTIFTANIESINTYLVPAVKCGTNENIRIHEKYMESAPKLYVSPGVKAKLEEYKSAIPCANKHTRELFEYVEGVL